MSRYYKVLDMKVRVSDHEPNTKLNGSSDVYFYTKSADNRKLCVIAQIESYCDKHELEVELFQVIIDDVNIGEFEDMVAYNEDNESSSNGAVYAMLDAYRDDARNVLAAYSLSTTFGSTMRKEVKVISETTGISQSLIKKYFNIR